MATQPHISLSLPSIRRADAGDKDFAAPFGLFARRKIKAMARRKLIVTTKAIEEAQYQPASLDLRLAKEAYRVRASFLPGRDAHGEGASCEASIRSRSRWPATGAVLEKGIVYIARIAERLALLPSISGAANPKSSTGRLDIFTRLIVDRSEAFDEVPLGYRGAALARNFAAQLQRARARRVEAQPDPIPQPKLAADGPAEFRAEGPGNQAGATLEPRLSTAISKSAKGLSCASP